MSKKRFFCAILFVVCFFMVCGTSRAASSSLEYSSAKVKMQKMWLVGPNKYYAKFFTLIKKNKSGASITFKSEQDYIDTVIYYEMITGDEYVKSRNKWSAGSLTFTVIANKDNTAYTSGKKGFLRYYKKSYKWLSKAGVKNGMPKKTAVRKIASYIKKKASYGGGPGKFNFYSIMDTSKGVCNAYSQLFQTMCVQAGIDCRFCFCTLYNASHSCCRVKIGTSWYYVDVCSADTSGSSKYLLSKKLWSGSAIKKDYTILDSYHYYNHGVGFLYRY